MNKSRLVELFAQADELKAAIQTVDRRLVEARRRWARSTSTADAAALEEVESKALRLGEQFDALVRAMEQSERAHVRAA